MLLSLLADILAVDSLIRLWANPLPQLWWQILVMFFGDFLLRALHKGAIRRSGKKSSSSRNLGLLALFNRLGLIGLGLASILP
jgi:hypothetical protein